MELIVRTLQVHDVTQSYVDWYSNHEVVKYSDNQYKTFSLRDQRAYVRSCLLDDDRNLFGIFDDDIHIGNVLLSGLRSFHRRAQLSYVLGNTSYWGMGIATSAVAEVVSFSKEHLNLNKIFAGVAKGNVSSSRVLEKNGFVVEGVRKNHLIYNGVYYDQIDYGLII